MRARDRVFVDTDAWIASMLSRGPLHTNAIQAWAFLRIAH